MENDEEISKTAGNENQLHVGQKFSSYTELTENIKRYEIFNRQKFYKSRSRTVEAIAKQLKRSLKSSLEYYELEYSCIHGKERGKRGNGLRHTRTVRLGCGAKFKLRIDSSGNYLAITSLNLEHMNHNLSQTVFEHLHQNRQLDSFQEKDIQTYLSLGANKKKIQQKILNDTGKKTTLKDLQNIQYKLKIRQNDLEEAVKVLQTKYCCSVHVLCDEEKQFKALYFNTENMRNSMSAWPEFVSVDGTYKLLDIGCTLFLFLVEDSNGQSEIVSAALISVEDKESYQWLFNIFKNQMDSAGIMCFMGDKDLVERDVIKEVFPDTPVYLCVFHTLKTFRREINCEKLNISKEERDLSLEHLQRMVYCRNDTEYNILYTQFKECVPQKVSQYFDRNWHGIRDEWLVCKMTNSNLNNTTNNRMESINQKIKQVVPKNSSLIDFVNHFFIFIESHYQERDSKAANHILKKSLKQFASHENDLRLYMDFLTNYSFDYVQRQISSISKVSIVNGDEDGTFVATTSAGNLLVTPDNCQCAAFSSMMLPCKHIFALRTRQNLPLFDSSVCHIRWTKEYYLTKQRIGSRFTGADAPELSCTTSKNRKVMTLSEKRKSATLVTNSLVQLLSLASNSDFTYKLDMLKKIEYCWKRGKEVSIEVIDKSDDDDDDDGQISACENVVKDSDIQLPPDDVPQNRMESEASSCDYRLVQTDDADGFSENVASSQINDDIPSEDEHDIRDTSPLNNLPGGSAASLNDNNYFDNDFDAQFTTYISNSENGANEDQNISEELRSITLPPKIRKRGRPKGHDTTTIGLKKKRSKVMPMKFANKSKLEQLLYIMSVICNEDLTITCESIENNTVVITENDLKNDPPDVVLDPSVVLTDIQPYFTPQAWELLSRKVSEKKKKNDWKCKFCLELIGHHESIICECCLFWIHIKCAGLSQIPKIRTWFCRSCY